MSQEELSEEARRRYPIGTVYKCASSKTQYKLIICAHNYLYYGLTNNIDAGFGIGYLYYNGKWAEIVFSPLIEQSNYYFY